MKHPQTGICREGCPFLALVAFSALLFAILGLWFPALACLLLLWLSSHFFRDPERVCPQERHCALSPADGRIVRIEQADEPFTGKRLTCISISAHARNTSKTSAITPANSSTRPWTKPPGITNAAPMP